MVGSRPTVVGQSAAQMLASLRATAAPRTYAPDTQLTHQGETEHTFYVIEDGRVAVSRRLEDDTEQLLNVLGPRHIFGEMALLDLGKRSATVKCSRDHTVLHGTDGDDIARGAAKHPLGFLAHGQNVCGTCLNCHHRRLT